KAYVAAMQRSGLEPPAAPGSDRPVYVRLPYLARHRPALQAAANQAKLLLGEWFEAPVHPRQTNRAAIGYTDGSCPIGEQTSERIVNLPCHPGITPTDVERYIALLEQVET